MNYKQHINTLEDFSNICWNDATLSGHYCPKKYLKKYNFSPNVLLDVFCTDYMIFSYEDNYYNDFNLSMIREYQPHINIDEFKLLSKELDSVMELIKRSELLLEVIENNETIGSISKWQYNNISNYIDQLIKLDIKNKEIFNKVMVDNYLNYIQTNKYSGEMKNIESNQDPITIAKCILNTIPKVQYSSILSIK